MSSTDLGSIVVHSLRARCIDCLYVRWYRDQLLRYNSSSTYSASILAGTTINNYLWRCSCTAATRSTTILCVFTVQQWPFRPPICPPLRPACLLIAAGIPWPDHFALCCDVYLCLVVLWPQQHWLQYQISSPWGIGRHWIGFAGFRWAQTSVFCEEYTHSAQPVSVPMPRAT